MIKQLLIIPAFTLLCFSFFAQLSELAESSADKAIDFAEDMEKAIDCATRGEDLSVCSPELFSHDFEQEIEELTDTAEEITAIVE